MVFVELIGANILLLIKYSDLMFTPLCVMYCPFSISIAQVTQGEVDFGLAGQARSRLLFEDRGERLYFLFEHTTKKMAFLHINIMPLKEV